MICKNCGLPIKVSWTGTLIHTETEIVWCDVEAFRALPRAES